MLSLYRWPTFSSKKAVIDQELHRGTHGRLRGIQRICETIIPWTRLEEIAGLSPEQILELAAADSRRKAGLLLVDHGREPGL